MNLGSEIVGEWKYKHSFPKLFQPIMYSLAPSNDCRT